VCSVCVLCVCACVRWVCVFYGPCAWNKRFWFDHGDSLYITGVWFVLCIIRRSCSCPCTYQSQTEHTTDCIPCNSRFIPNFVQIGRHLGEWQPKNLSVTYTWRPYLWSIAVNEKTGIWSNRYNQILSGRQECSTRADVSCSTSAGVQSLVHRSCASYRRSGGINQSLIDDSTLDVT